MFFPAAAAAVAIAASGVAPETADSSAAGHVALSWARAAGAEPCPSSEDVARRVDALLRREVFDLASVATLFIDASIEPGPGANGWKVRIAVSSKSGGIPGTREMLIDEADCAAAADSAALAIALIIDPTADIGAEPAEFAPSPEPAPSTATPAEPTPAPVPTPAADTNVNRALRPEQVDGAPHARRVRLALGLLGSLGQLPAAGLGAFGSVRLAHPGGRVGVDMTGDYLASSSSAQARPGAGGSFDAAALGLAGWWSLWRAPRATLAIAAGAQVGRITAKGYGFTAATRNANSWLLNGSLDAELVSAVNEQWATLFRLGVGVPFWRDTFEATSATGATELVFRPARVVASLTIGVAFQP